MSKIDYCWVILVIRTLKSNFWNILGLTVEAKDRWCRYVLMIYTVDLYLSLYCSCSNKQQCAGTHIHTPKIISIAGDLVDLTNHY